MSRANVTVFLVALAFGAMAMGCKQKVGGSCAAGQLVCADEASALTCGADSKFAAVSCRGPKGCSGSAKSVLCDNSLAAEKDRCDEEGDFACSVDKKSALTCKGGTFVVGETCKGARGCEVKGNSVSCDNDIADLNDPCLSDFQDYACTQGTNPTLLSCTAHKMTALNSCRGPKGCRIVEQDKKVEFACDDSIAAENDPCDELSEKACSTDKKSVLECKGHKFAVLKACPGPKGCSTDDKEGSIDCDTEAASAAAPADPAKAAPLAVAEHKAAKAKKGK